MSTFVVKAFPAGKVSDDGTVVAVTVETTDGQSHRLEVPFDRVEWLHQALLKLSMAAYRRQVRTGRLVRGPGAVDAPIVAEMVRVLPDTAHKHALIQVTGRQSPNRPLGLGSMIVDEGGARNLGRRLLEVADQLKQTSRPS
jgi:hypothetical protein